ncbi:MAG: sulfotransferase domain-containing protein [Bacteroidota bacterium]
MKENSDRHPDFFVIGAAKSGTSSLYEYLTRHPRIFMPELKEPEFFSREAVYNQGIGWYQNLFSAAAKDQLCGEASTTYSRWPHTLDAPKLIFNTVPDAKFIYIMRNPVDRAYSHYGHHMREGVTMTFEEALKKDTIYVDCSMYMDQIKRYLRYFPHEKFLFLFQEELKNNPEALLQKITAFLNLENINLASNGIVKRNVGGADHFIRSKTTMKLRRIPPIGFLAACMPKSVKDKMYAKIRNSFIGKRLEKSHQLTPMKAETRKSLLDQFEKNTTDLEDFLGIKLDSWRK